MNISKEDLTLKLKYKPSLEGLATHYGVSADTISRRIFEFFGCSFKEARSRCMEPVKESLINKALSLALVENNFQALKLCLENYCHWGKDRNNEDSEDRKIHIVISSDEVDS